MTAIGLVIVALAFAWSMGAHYTGACMGMPHATGSISARPALRLMAAFTFLGALVLSRKVLVQIGHGLLDEPLDQASAIIAIGTAFALTTLFTSWRIPTSTIQIFVFALTGVGTALGVGIDWPLVIRLAVLWVVAPVVACALGYGLTRILDHVPAIAFGRPEGRAGVALVAVGVLASLAMGANDVANASAVLLSAHVASANGAALIGGAGLALGVLTWGRPLLERLAFDVVRLDFAMATAAQAVQAVVVLTAVGFGYFTSMNQALVGAMAGAGLARGRQTIDRRVTMGILRGWLFGPTAGFALAFGLTLLYRAAQTG